ncbi:MAG: ankyrin repeat domain-containing protein [Fimbriimonas sp.]|nr:ankyrin repeat domain-containing protein [Fimbriimonas sp.]
MTIKCLVGSHLWNGCKCTACGKTRDEAHDWSKDCEKCFACARTRDGGHDFSQGIMKCARCGATNTDAINSLLGAAILGDEGRVKALVASGVDVSASGSDGETALIKVAVYGHTELARVLIAAGANVNAKNKHSDTALTTAAYGGHRELVEVLVAAGADVMAKNVNGYTALMVARRDDVAAVLRKAPRLVHPTLTCSACGKTYRIGEDAVAVAPEFAYGLISKSVIDSEGPSPDREDLVDFFGDSNKSAVALDTSRENARQNWKIIQEGLARGQRRTWRCHGCDKVNSYQVKS